MGTLYKIKIIFYEIMNSDFTGILLKTPHTWYSNVDIEGENDEECYMYPNQTIEKEMTQDGIDCLIEALELRTVDRELYKGY